MSFASINKAAIDPQLRARVEAAANKEVRYRPGSWLTPTTARNC